MRARLIAEFYRAIWAILPETFMALEAVLLRWADGVKLSADEVALAIAPAANIHAARRGTAQVSAEATAIGVLPISGVIGHRASLVHDASSGVGTSTELLGRDLRAMLADPQVGAIVLDIDSPGGSVFGVQELGEQIVAARKVKPVVAVANSQAASAAYWLAAQADELIITPGGEVGSIGVVAAHDDVSKAMEGRGVRRTFITAGKYKVEGHPYAPLETEAHAYMQARVDEYYDQFIKAVAAGRRDTQTAVREGYGQGRMLGAAAAVKANLADRIDTFDNVIGQLSEKLARAKRAGSARSAHALERERIDLVAARTRVGLS